MQAKFIYSLFMLSTLALAVACGAMAEDRKDTSPSDLQCLAVGTMMSASHDQQARSFGVIMAVYYLGRLDGSGRGADIGTKLAAEGLLLTPREIQAVQVRCRSQVGLRTKALAVSNNSLGAKH